jgi:hypothetical protein
LVELIFEAAKTEGFLPGIFWFAMISLTLFRDEDDLTFADLVSTQSRDWRSLTY